MHALIELPNAGSFPIFSDAPLHTWIAEASKGNDISFVARALQARLSQQEISRVELYGNRPAQRVYVKWFNGIVFGEDLWLLDFGAEQSWFFPVEWQSTQLFG